MRKKGQSSPGPKNYFFGIIIFTLVVVGGIVLITQFRDTDSTFVDNAGNTLYRFNSTFNKMSDLNSQVSKMKNDAITPQDTGFFGMVNGVINGLINSAWTGLTFLFSGLTFMDDAFQGLSIFLGVPEIAFLGALLGLMVTIMIIFAIWGAAFMREL